MWAGPGGLLTVHLDFFRNWNSDWKICLSLYYPMGGGWSSLPLLSYHVLRQRVPLARIPWGINPKETKQHLSFQEFLQNFSSSGMPIFPPCAGLLHKALMVTLMENGLAGHVGNLLVEATCCTQLTPHLCNRLPYRYNRQSPLHFGCCSRYLELSASRCNPENNCLYEIGKLCPTEK